MTSLFRNIAVNIWWTPLNRFNITDCEGMKSSFGSCLIYKNAIFASVASMHTWWDSNVIPRASHLWVLGTSHIGLVSE